jgi:chromosome segregation protein
MKLRGLRLHGFKSFADVTALEFRDGLTAIVGSNGCGKSNLADAVRWVLGEQRASAIRGSKMEEVIFQGTTRRRPLHLAEVSLHFDNSDGSVAVPQTEIEVARKVFREGGSEYSINRQPCRLRDVHNLLRGTGLGSHAYAVIESGMIETLLSDRAEERRMLFEEAAGIGRYKDSRHAALRRLEAAEADLGRLNDLLAEVESKVRSLSRQRRRAERFTQLRARRATLEVWLADAERLALQTESQRLTESHRVASEAEQSAAAEREWAERLTADQRATLGGLTRERGLAAEQLEELRAQLEARERESLVASERASHAELRIEQLSREQVEVRQAAERTDSDIARHQAEVDRRAEALRELQATLEERTGSSRALREALRAGREATERLAGKSRELARQISGAEGEHGATERRLQDFETRVAEAKAELRRVEDELGARDREAEALARLESDAGARLTAAREEAEAAREQLRVQRSVEKAAREELEALQTRLSRLDAQVGAREAVERGYEGFAPAVAALLNARERPAGVLGPLIDFIGEVEDARAIDAYLGGMLQGVVVSDLEVARQVRDWFERQWKGGGSLLLLPLDALPVAGGPAAWGEVLLRDVIIVEGDPLSGHVPGRARVGRSGGVVDERGVVRLSDPRSAPGLLDRREELAGLKRERAALQTRVERLSGERESRTSQLREREDQAVELEESLRVTEAGLRRARSDVAAHQQLVAQLQREHARVDATLAGLADSERLSRLRLAECEVRWEELNAAAGDASAAEEASRARLSELELQWEGVRDEEAELRIAVARFESDVREVERRLSGAEHARRGSASRLATIERELGELRSALEGLASIRERARGSIAGLAAGRDETAERVARLDADLARLDASLAELSQRAASARRTETSAGEDRHRLELEISELRFRSDRLIEKVEVEWGRPFDALRASIEPPDDHGPQQWRAELAELLGQLDTLGAVNLLAVEEHTEEEARLNFLLEQRADLVKARDDLTAAIRQINRTAREVFLTTFETVRTNFHRVFQSLFPGGTCDIWLAEPDSPLESPVEIQASPKGKRTQRIHLLSGGERTLTALALVFALYLVKPAPFCVLDEIDAPLDDSNVQRFLQLLQDFKVETQFVVITHNPATMEAADWVYGVTMEEPGISSIVGVELLGRWQREDRVA